MPTYDNQRQGEHAEKWIANEYELEHAPNEASWYDCVNWRTGTKWEVKSAHKTVKVDYDGQNERRIGRFRLWEDQHRSLAAAAGQEGQSAWYAFVLLNSDGQIVKHRRMRPTTVTKIINGTWNDSEHQERGSDQHKIPHPDVFNY